MTTNHCQRLLLGPLFLLIALGATPFLVNGDTDTPNPFFAARSENGKVEVFIGGVVDWRGLAPAEYKSFDFRNPPASLLKVLKGKTDEFSSAELDFFSPVPEHLKRSFYYLISADGVQLLQLQQLHGTAQYFFDSKGGSLRDPPHFSGSLVATIDGNKAPKGGFAVRFLKAQRIPITKVEINVKAYPSIWQVHQAEIAAMIGKRSKTWEIVHSFGFRLGNDEAQYAFIQWGMDEDSGIGSCGSRFSILTVGESPREVAWNIYDCDI